MQKQVLGCSSQERLWWEGVLERALVVEVDLQVVFEEGFESI
jgi:hypothetical protein